MKIKEFEERMRKAVVVALAKELIDRVDIKDGWLDQGREIVFECSVPAIEDIRVSVSTLDVF